MDLLIIADDLTGANDSAVQFANTGSSTATLLNLSGRFDFEKYDVIAVSTETRSVSPEKAYMIVRKICSEINQGKRFQVFKKIDSSLRGYIGAEIDAVMDEFNFDTALVVPAYPINGRITSGGYHLINQIPVGESDIKNDPVTPVTESNLVKLLESQTKRKIGYLSLETISKGLQAVRNEIQCMSKNGNIVIVCDATTNYHLDILGKSIIDLKKTLVCGTAGLANALAKLKKDAVTSRLGLSENKNIIDGGILGICGSQSSVTRAQIEYARMNTKLKMIEIDQSRLVLPELFNEEVLQVSNRAVQGLKQNNNALIYMGIVKEEISSEERNLRKLILSAIISITQQIVNQVQIRGLVLTGGDTAMAVCQSLNTESILIEGEIFPGIVKGELVGGLLPERTLITKSGSFGEPKVLSCLFDFFN